MDIPPKPNKGDPAIPYITNATLWGVLIDMANAWQRGEIGPPPGITTAQVNPLGINPDDENPVTEILQKLGRLSDPTRNTSDPAVMNLAFAKPTFDLEDPVWPTAFDRLHVMRRDLPPSGMDPVRTGRYATVPVGGSGPYAMIDPVNPTQLTNLYSGEFRQLESFADPEAHSVLDLQDSQRIYTFTVSEERDDIGAYGQFQAEVKDISGATFTTNQVTIHDPIGFSANMRPGDTGTCKLVGDKWFVIGQQGLDTVLIKFRIDGIADTRIYAATIEYITGRVLDPEIGGAWGVADSANVYDIENQFTMATPGATGWAVWVVQEAPNPDDPPIERWEMISCTLPIEEIEVETDECMYKTNSDTWYGTFTWNNETPTTNWNRGTGTNVDFDFHDSAFTSLPNNKWRLDFENPYGLDCVAGSKVRVRRVADKQPTYISLPADTESYTYGGYQTNVRWEAVSVTKPIARWICVLWDGQEFEIYGPPGYWEGEDPRECDGQPIVRKGCLDVDLDCVEPLSKFICCWNPEDEVYHIVSSISGVLGNPVTKKVPTGEPTVSTDPEDCEAGNYCFEWPVTNMLSWTCDDNKDEDEPEPDPIKQCINGADFFHCVDLCQYICTYCESYADDPECDDPPCLEYCLWEWDGIANWEQVEDNCTDEPDCQCPGEPNFDGTILGQQVEVPCEKVPEFTDCPNCTDCDPNQRMLISTLNFNHSTSSVNNPIGGLIDGEGAIAAYSQNGAATPRSQCEWRVPIRWRVTGKLSRVDVFEDDMATVSYDHGTSTWTVDVDNGSPATPDTGDYEGIGNCAGLTCGPFGNCTWVDGTFPLQTLGGQIGTTTEPCPPAQAVSTLMFQTRSVPDVTKFGDYFKNANPELFANCTGCSNGFVATLNRMGSDLRDTTVDKVAAGIAKKSKQADAEEVKQRIRNAHASWLSSQL